MVSWVGNNDNLEKILAGMMKQISKEQIVKINMNKKCLKITSDPLMGKLSMAPLNWNTSLEDELAALNDAKNDDPSMIRIICEWLFL